MWDAKQGGFFNLVKRDGTPIPEFDGALVKQAYGNAFGLFALSAYYVASGDTGALNFAHKVFSWLDGHSFDPQYGGYFQFMAVDGTPMVDGIQGVPPKDYNSMLHLLEALTEYYRAAPDSLVRERLLSTFHAVRDHIIAPGGYLKLYFRRDWTPISYQDSSVDVRKRNYEFDHVTFGHDVETAYLMLEASETLGLKNDTMTLRVAKALVDHALKYGWDQRNGGLYDGGYYERGASRPVIARSTKEWWGQAEALNAFLMMSRLFPDDPHQYRRKFQEQWTYCRRYLIDSVHSGWYWGGIDQEPRNVTSPKASIWKAAYHTARSMVRCIRMLKD